jgi:mannan endo-1,4-beta-mannosidase
MKTIAAFIYAFFIFHITSSQDKSSYFVVAKEGKFFRGGKEYFFMGANYWQGMNLAGALPGSDPDRLRRELNQMKKSGITNLRIMALTEGPDNSPYRILPAVQDEPGVLKEEVLSGLDVLLEEMRKRDMTAVVVLNNFWQWSGGMGQYVKWHTGDTIPYPPPHSNGSWDNFQKYVARFYTIREAVNHFNESIQKVVNRRNTVNGIFYREDPTIMAWELANEPRGINQAEVFYEWIHTTASHIKELDKNHMVTTGAEGYTPSPEAAGTDFVRMHNSPYIDYTTAHIWIQNWGWYNPQNHERSYPPAEDKMTNYLMKHAAESKKLGKPFVLEEFGIMKDNGSFDPEATTKHRDQYYKEVFDQVYLLARKGEASGVNFWAWGGEGRPRQPETWWKKGDDFTGDPPHEPQGWYSVYNHDRNTIKIIKRYSRKLSKLK